MESDAYDPFRFRFWQRFTLVIWEREFDDWNTRAIDYSQISSVQKQKDTFSVRQLTIR